MLKNNKAAGYDEIALELLKYGGDKLKIEIWNVIKEVWMIEKMPEDWNTSIICPIYKKIDAMVCDNYRGISLLYTTYKILFIIILNHLRPYAVDITEDYHSNFLLGRSTIDHIFTLKQLKEINIVNSIRNCI